MTRKRDQKANRQTHWRGKKEEKGGEGWCWNQEWERNCQRCEQMMWRGSNAYGGCAGEAVALMEWAAWPIGASRGGGNQMVWATKCGWTPWMQKKVYERRY